MGDSQIGLFCQQLDTETRVIVQHEDEELDRNMGDAGNSFVLACHNLRRIHEALRYKRSGFVDYCNGKPGLEKTTAYKMLDVAKMFPDSGNIYIKSKEALYLLASSSTPEEIRTEFLNRAQNGETITHSIVKDALGVHKTINPLVAYGGSAPAHVQQVVDDYTQAEREESAQDHHLDAALADEDKSVCPECGLVYDGPRCPDCIPYNYKRDNQRSTTSDIYTPLGMDACQSPPYAIDPLLPYIPRTWTIWEPAAGEGNLVEALFDSGFSKVVSSDILTGQNFFEFEPDEWDCLLTNPPYSIQFQWIERCYKLGQPFALLLKVDVLGTKNAQELFDRHGIEVIFVSPRINFKMPRKGWDGKGAQFATAWFTHGLNIGRQMTFAKVRANDASN